MIVLALAFGCAPLKAWLSAGDDLDPVGEIAVTPANLDMGDIELEDTLSGSESVQVLNAGSGLLLLDEPVIEAEQGEWHATIEDTIALLPGDQTGVLISVTPGAPGDLEATLVLQDRDGEQTFELPITVSAKGGAAVLEGDSEISGACGLTWTGTLTNTGNRHLEVLSVEVSTSGAADVDVSGVHEGTEVHAGEEREIEISFDEAVEGTWLTTLTIETTDPLASTSDLEIWATVERDFVTDRMVSPGMAADLLLAVAPSEDTGVDTALGLLQADIDELATLFASLDHDLRVGVTTDEDAPEVVDLSRYSDADDISTAVGHALARATTAWPDPIERAGVALDSSTGFPAEGRSLQVMVMHGADIDRKESAADTLAEWEAHVSEPGLLGVHGMSASTSDNSWDFETCPAIEELVDASGGVWEDLASPDMPVFVHEVIWYHFDEARTLALAQEPAEDYLTVELNGEPLDEDHWSYVDGNTAWFVRLDSDYALESGDTIDATYLTAADCQ